MLETALSPIFGLTLIELVEHLGIMGLSVGVVTAIMLGIQIRRQRKVDSARFTVDYVDKILEKGKDVTDTLYDREDDNTKKFKKEKDVRVMLNGFENTIRFVNDGVIDKKQMLTTLRITLQMLKKDTEVQRIIKEKQKNKPKAFEKIVKFMNEEID